LWFEYLGTSIQANPGESTPEAQTPGEHLVRAMVPPHLNH
jgi:hypothetical protein